MHLSLEEFAECDLIHLRPDLAVPEYVTPLQRGRRQTRPERRDNATTEERWVGATKLTQRRCFVAAARCWYSASEQREWESVAAKKERSYDSSYPSYHTVSYRIKRN